MNEYDSSHEKKYYTYYQWVCFVLFFQVSFNIFHVTDASTNDTFFFLFLSFVLIFFRIIYDVIPKIYYTYMFSVQ